MNLISILTFEEGYRSVPYLCSEGYVTVGLGTKLHKSKGMNPNDFPIRVSRKMAEEWLGERVASLHLKLASPKSNRFHEEYSLLSDDRKAILLSMSYQMGLTGVLQFRKMWAAIAARDYEEAGRQALDSAWAKQTPERAMRHAQVLAGEKLSHVYENFEV